MSLHPGTDRYNPAGNSDFTRKAEALALGITNWSTPKATDGAKGGPGQSYCPFLRRRRMADTGRAELEGQQPGQRGAGRWQIPDGYPALPGGAGLHPPGPGDHDGWAAVLAARPDLAPAVGFDDCLAWARRMSADPEGPARRRLNPLFVGWLMGWPIGHALCACSATEFTLWQQRMRGALSQLPMASGPWIWRPTERPEGPAQMNLFEGVQP